MELTDEFEWRGRRVRWGRIGCGPDLVFCHGTPWSSQLWAPYAKALGDEFTVHLWDMPGFGQSSKSPDHSVSLDLQGELFTDLLSHWDLQSPHVIAHDLGGAVALRALLLHGCAFASLALVDVVAIAPWGSDFFRLVREHPEAFAALPGAVHQGVLRAYIEGASYVGLTPSQLEMLIAPWLGAEGQAAFYRQIAEADQAFTDEIQGLYPTLDLPVLVAWGMHDTWIPVDRAHRLIELIPAAQLELIERAGHLVQIDQPVQLATRLHRWLTSRTSVA